MSVKGIRGLGYGTGYLILPVTISGPSSYDATNGHVIDAKAYGFTKVDTVIAKVRDAGNLQVVVATISGTNITLRYYTIAADTGTGAITATEVANGTDLSGYTVELIIFGQ